MLQNPCKTLGFKKNMVYKIPPGGEVNHIQPVAYTEPTLGVKGVISLFVFYLLMYYPPLNNFKPCWDVCY